MQITRTTDALGRDTGLSLAGADYGVSYAYDSFVRFQSVTSAESVDIFTYSCLPNSDLLSGMTASSGFLWTRAYESGRSLITSVENRFDDTVISRYDYANDELGRRTSIARSGLAFGDVPVKDAYGYNTRSEVTSARRSLADSPSQEVRGFSYDYEYDPIGNRISSTEYDHENNALVSAYAANELNQYEQRSVPGYAGVRGTATNTATVTVNGNPTWRLDDYFYGGDEADNALAALMKELAITAVYNPPGTNDPDVVTSQTGRVFVVQSPEAFTYDDDGNLTQDGRFDYTWNGENRLIKAETRDDLPAAVPRVKVEYAYDHQGRRVSRSGYAWDTDHWALATDHSFLYDGWNVIAETIQNQQSIITNHYVWGLDLSGSLQGAGGIGGLLSASLDGTTTLYSYDANGNVCQLANPDGELLAHYEYSPFGETIVSTGPQAKANPFRFSTKWLDNDTGLGDWGYRYYHPEMGRWMSRDPIGERGGVNLTATLMNNLPNKSDKLGMIEVSECQGVVALYDQMPYVKKLKGIPELVIASTHITALSLPPIIFLPPGSRTRPPCLNTITCSKCCIGKGSGSYNPLTRDIVLCADRLINKSESETVLRHELSHAESLCVVPLPLFDCTACMKEEKTAWARALCGAGVSDETCNNIVTEQAHSSCYWFPCFSSKWQDYLNVPYDKELPPIPWPPNPHFAGGHLPCAY